MSDTFVCQGPCGREMLADSIVGGKLISNRQVSHDVPQYIGGTDKDGRHLLCKRCHDMYERQVFAEMVRGLPESLKQAMRGTAKRYARSFFSNNKVVAQ